MKKLITIITIALVTVSAMFAEVKKPANFVDVKTWTVEATNEIATRQDLLDTLQYYIDAHLECQERAAETIKKLEPYKGDEKADTLIANLESSIRKSADIITGLQKHLKKCNNMTDETFNQMVANDRAKRGL